MIQIFRGNDQKILFKKRLNDNSFVDFTLYDDVIVFFYTFPDCIQKYSLNPRIGYGKIQLIDNYTGQIWLETALFQPGKLRMEIRISRTNLELTDQKEDEIAADIIAEIVPTKILIL